MFRPCNFAVYRHTESMEVNRGNTGHTLKAHLLVAMPGLVDPRFSHSVIYICEHSPEGAMGLVINQPLNMPLRQMFEQLDLHCPKRLDSQSLLLGGPVEQQRGFILHRHTEKQWQSTVIVDDEVSLTASRDILEAIASDNGPEDSLIILGYAGWGPGQLEREILENAWLTTPTSTDLLFGTPFDNRASTAAARIGIDLDQLSTSAGHA